MKILMFVICMGLLQLAHAFVIMATDGEWATKSYVPFSMAVIIDACVVIALLA